MVFYCFILESHHRNFLLNSCGSVDVQKTSVSLHRLKPFLSLTTCSFTPVDLKGAALLKNMNLDLIKHKKNHKISKNRPEVLMN